MIYTGKVAVVTGASSGLGRRFALDLASHGAVVTAVARREDRLKQVAGEMRRTSPDSGYTACDVGDTDAYAALLAGVEQERGRVDILVNNAGVERDVGVDDVTLDDYRSIFATNFFATVAGTLAVLPGMLRRGDGVVVNMSSDDARAPAPGNGAYAASKAALSAFTESLSYETQARGVHLHVLYPGWVPTPMGQGAVDGGMAMPPKFVRRTEEQVSKLLLAKMGGPLVEINAARAAVFAPVARALFPRGYRKGRRRTAGEA
jgi:short-subunit dehydrogenase